MFSFLLLRRWWLFNIAHFFVVFHLFIDSRKEWASVRDSFALGFTSRRSTRFCTIPCRKLAPRRAESPAGLASSEKPICGSPARPDSELTGAGAFFSGELLNEKSEGPVPTRQQGISCGCERSWLSAARAHENERSLRKG